MEQLIREGSLFGAVAIVTFGTYVTLRKIGGTPTEYAGRVLSGMLGIFLFIAGLSKFFMPFSGMFADQVMLSQLPAPHITIITIHAGEICSGLMLMLFSAAWYSLRGTAFNALFHVTNTCVITIMLTMAYIHLHPDVPTSVLPFGVKPPVASLLLTVFAMMNASSPRASAAQARTALDDLAYIGAIMIGVAMALTAVMTWVTIGFSETFLVAWMTSLAKVVIMLLPFSLLLTRTLGRTLVLLLPNMAPVPRSILLGLMMAIVVHALMALITTATITGFHDMELLHGLWANAAVMTFPICLMLVLLMLVFLRPRMEALFGCPNAHI